MDEFARYHRQMLLPEIGSEGQQRLRDGRALVVGCGALGTVICEMLVRAGVGHVRVIDRDVIELTNLQRQVLFDEDDLAAGLPKAEAARRKLEKINSQVAVEAIVDDFNHTNADGHAEGVDVIIDGLDNFETRYILNDLAVKKGIGYVYGGAVGTNGMTATFLPHFAGENETSRRWRAEVETPCLRCLFPAAPPPGTGPTCDTVGVLGPVVSTIANMQAVEAIKILTGNFECINRDLVTLDLWQNTMQRLDVSAARQREDCPCCAARTFEYLDGVHAGASTVLCGRGAVQITPAQKFNGGLATLAARLEPHGTVTHNRFLLRAELREGETKIELTVFANGRAIVKGTTSPEAARTIYSKYIGI